MQRIRNSDRDSPSAGARLGAMVMKAIKLLGGTVKMYEDSAGFRSQVKKTVQGIRKAFSNVKTNTGTDNLSSEMDSAADILAADPLNSGISRTQRMARPVPGQQHIFTGGESNLSPLQMRLGAPATSDNLKSFLARFNRRGRVTTEFVNQIVGDDQIRSVQMLCFRHRIPPSTITAHNRALKPTSSYRNVTLIKQVGTTRTSVAINGLPYNYYDTSLGDNGKVLYANTSLNDLENDSFKLLGYEGNIYSETAGTTARVLAPPGEGEILGTTTLSSPNANTVMDQENRSQVVMNAGAYPRYEFRPVIRDGGVHLHLQNKHQSGCFVEIIVLRLKQGRTVTPFPNNGTAATATTEAVNIRDGVLNEYVNALSAGYMRKNFEAKSSVSNGGKVPLVDDIYDSPYYPLLPESPGYTDAGACHLVQKKRIKFALPSGGKRDVTLKFGGKVYNPSSQKEGDAFPMINDFAYFVLIAVNGQQVSAHVVDSAAGGSSLITGDACTGHNLFIKGEYFEDLQAAHVLEKRSTRMLSYGEVDPDIPTSALPTGVTMSPYLIIAANKIQREPTAIGGGLHTNNNDGNSHDETFREEH